MFSVGSNQSPYYLLVTKVSLITISKVLLIIRIMIIIMMMVITRVIVVPTQTQSSGSQESHKDSTLGFVFILIDYDNDY